MAARLAPWVVAVGVLGLLFHQTPVGSVLAHIRHAAPWTLPVGILGVAAIFLCDCFAISKTFGWFVTPIRFADVLLVRGASYCSGAEGCVTFRAIALNLEQSPWPQMTNGGGATLASFVVVLPAAAHANQANQAGAEQHHRGRLGD